MTTLFLQVQYRYRKCYYSNESTSCDEDIPQEFDETYCYYSSEEELSNTENPINADENKRWSSQGMTSAEDCEEPFVITLPILSVLGVFDVESKLDEKETRMSLVSCACLNGVGTCLKFI